MTTFPFTLETPLERRIAADPEWQRGLEYGKPRRGHPEGAVKHHIRDVLSNVDRFQFAAPFRSDLRLIALIHDTFKHQVDRSQPVVGRNSHEYLARRFAERFIEDERVLDVLEFHDTPFKLYRREPRPEAEHHARILIARLGAALPLFMKFYICDNLTVGKDQDHLCWFAGLASGSRQEEISPETQTWFRPACFAR